MVKPESLFCLLKVFSACSAFIGGYNVFNAFRIFAKRDNNRLKIDSDQIFP